MSVMLYYPHVSPSEAALHQAVLYWDRLATIVPAQYEKLVTPELLRLRDAGLYRPMEIERQGLGLSARGDDEPIIETALDELQRKTPPHELMPDRSDSFLYPAKIGPAIERILLNRGLAQRADPTDRFSELRVPRMVSFVVVSTLARYLADYESRRETKVVPFTDREIAHRAAHELPSRVRSSLSYEPALPSWEVELGALLPVPSPGTDLARLIEFRQRHEDERGRLILAVDMLVNGLQRNPDYPHDVYRMVSGYLADAVRELEAAGRARKITWMYRSLSVVIALAASAAGEKLVPGAGWALGTLSGMAINVATSQVRNTPYEIGQISYLARVQRELPRLAR
ncbi:DUF6236 family protein [Saccharopolyspora sp. K220]|uniref:DUF6236 family protein n=1 Tax=Saccharopolyspora soli TaxID=2926618 RepID=UPI001F578331|nr:DUF6236 family protein [Saccharopolyspora soli]MCI2424111.1 DUF6236 family protein [Saccharopolyspora soli]